MFALMELVFDALSLGTDIRESNREDREQRRRNPRRFTYAMWLVFFVVVLLLIQLF
jgi:hypothetical protein